MVASSDIISPCGACVHVCSDFGPLEEEEEESAE